MKKRTPDPDLEAHATGIIQRHLARPGHQKMWNLLTGDPEVQACWKMANYVAATKTEDERSSPDPCHGRHRVGAHHARPAGRLAFCARHRRRKIRGRDDAALVVITATLCHDLGNMVHREEHADLGVVLAMPILDRLLPKIYDDPLQRTAIRSFILSAMYTHHGTPSR